MQDDRESRNLPQTLYRYLPTYLLENLLKHYPIVLNKTRTYLEIGDCTSKPNFAQSFVILS